MITRKQYMNKEFTHAEYYAQFVDDSLKAYVADAIGKDKIKKSTDPYFNDIDLIQWDRLHGVIRMHCGKSLSESNSSTCAPGSRGGVSLSDTVCVAKAAARQIREES